LDHKIFFRVCVFVATFLGFRPRVPEKIFIFCPKDTKKFFRIYFFEVKKLWDIIPFETPYENFDPTSTESSAFGTLTSFFSVCAFSMTASHSHAKKEEEEDPLTYKCALPDCKKTVWFNPQAVSVNNVCNWYCTLHRREYNMRKCYVCHKFTCNDRNRFECCSRECYKFTHGRAANRNGTAQTEPQHYDHRCFHCYKGSDQAYKYTVSTKEGIREICSLICGYEQAQGLLSRR